MFLLFWDIYTEVLRINEHHVCNLFSNGSEKKICTYSNIHFLLYAHIESKVKRREKEKNKAM